MRTFIDNQGKSAYIFDEYKHPKGLYYNGSEKKVEAPKVEQPKVEEHKPSKMVVKKK